LLSLLLLLLLRLLLLLVVMVVVLFLILTLLGSLERFIAILIENANGKWPLWLNPHPIMVIPIGPKYFEYGEKVNKVFVLLFG
jgi:hypothetical protein